MRLDPGQLAALSAVLRCGAFDLAAAELHVTPSAVSQRIKALEDAIGTALVHRGSPCTATHAGQRLAKHAGDLAVLELQLMQDMALSGQISGARLRLAVNADSLATWFIDALAEVSDLMFELVIDDQDHSADWLERGEVSAAVTGTGAVARGCDRFELGALRYVATASPEFRDTWFAAGVTAQSLMHAPCITFNAKDRLQAQWMAAVTGERPTPPCHSLPSTQAFVDAAKSGLGWGMNPEVLVHDALANGSLVALLPDQPLDVQLHWQVGRAMAGAIAPLTEAVRRCSARHLLR